MTEIFEPEKEEYAGLTDVWEASVRATHDFLSEEDIAFFRPLILKEYLGAVSLYAIRDEENALAAFLGISGEQIEMLFVHPDHFREGLGKRLLLRALALGCWRVDVNEQNPGALAFYQQHGFKIVDRSETDGLGKPFPLLHLELR